MTKGEKGQSRRWPRLLDLAFRIGMAFKLVDGLLELVGAALIAWVPEKISRWVWLATAHELSEDPTDLIATHLRLGASRIAQHRGGFASLYLLVHGLIKVGLAEAVLRGRRWAYPWAMGFIGLFAGYEAYRAVGSASPALGGLALIDAAIVALLGWERTRFARAGMAGPTR